MLSKNKTAPEKQLSPVFGRSSVSALTTGTSIVLVSTLFGPLLAQVILEVLEQVGLLSLSAVSFSEATDETLKLSLSTAGRLSLTAAFIALVALATSNALAQRRHYELIEQQRCKVEYDECLNAVEQAEQMCSDVRRLKGAVVSLTEKLVVIHEGAGQLDSTKSKRYWRQVKGRADRCIEFSMQVLNTCPSRWVKQVRLLDSVTDALALAEDWQTQDEKLDDDTKHQLARLIARLAFNADRQDLHSKLNTEDLCHAFSVVEVQNRNRPTLKTVLKKSRRNLRKNRQRLNEIKRRMGQE